MRAWPKPSVSVKVHLLKRKEKLLSFMLYDLLSCVTPHPNYKTIIKTIKAYLPKDQKIWSDGVGNLIVKVGQDYTTMFSCHIDMVFGKAYRAEREDLSKPLDLFITSDKERSKAGFVWGGIITSYEKGVHIYTPTTLGSDDKAGIFIMLNLIRAKVPGLYLFHVGEELGGIGSLDISSRKPKLVSNIKRAIAFDRMDYFDIIDRQRGGVCCSDKFVNAFADQLNALIIAPNKINKKYLAATGTFTDTANYTSLIPECTNLSVGYFSQHSSEECLDTLWLEKILMPGLLKIDWEKLPTERSVTDKSHVYGALKPTTYVGKYVTYSDINYNTPSDKLPPWNLKKGLIKSCDESGMRRLIKHYIETTNSPFILQQAILELLQENAKAQQKGNGVCPEFPSSKAPLLLVQDHDTKQRNIFHDLKILTDKNFLVYKKCLASNLYTREIVEYGEMLEWAWSESYRFVEAPNTSLFKLCLVVKEILAEITVVNTTLLADITKVDSTFLVNKEVADIVLESVNFLNTNWIVLGYNTMVGVQDDLKRIRNKITTTP